MAEPNQTEYIFVTQKNFLSNDNEGRMVEKSFLIIQGAFLVKICDNTFKGIIGENAFEHIENFLKIVGPVKIKGLLLGKIWWKSSYKRQLDAYQDEICPPNKRYALMDANKKIDIDNPLCRNKSKIIASILQNHLLRFSIAALSSVPWIYLGKF
ncbi:hypothetical protein Tco_0124421 [Tanacetum coccineum]